MKTAKTIRLVLSGCAFGAAALSANTPLLVNPTDFSAGGNWIAGANRFLPATNWVGFDLLEVPDRVTISGNNVTFRSYDDGTSDRIESFLFQEFGAGPPGSPTANTRFQTGDVIVFTGEASGTRVGNNTGSMLVRAFVKMLGYNELGWEFQTKEAQTQFFNIGASPQAFELRVTFPDIVADESFQVLQVGFEIRTDFVGGSMQEGTITFSNINAVIEGDGPVDPPPATFGGIEIDTDGNVDTGNFLGVLFVNFAPWVYIHNMNRWVFMPDPGEGFTGAWTYLFEY